MTIQVHGYVKSVVSGNGPPGKYAVTVGFNSIELGNDMVFYVEAAALPHWLVGRIVQLTAYAFDAKTGTPK